MSRQAVLLAVSVLAAILALSAAHASAAPPRPLTLAMTGADEIFGPDAALAFQRLHGAGIAAIDTSINWSTIAPAQEPNGWNAADPGASQYDWSASDKGIKAIVAAGFQPMAYVYLAPTWARVTPSYVWSAPNTAKYAQFVRAAAERYSGKYPGIPRVRYWQIWNEPNISVFFAPQSDAPDRYRALVNAAAAAIHAVHADNVVIAGETAPFHYLESPGPLTFMRRMLCVDAGGHATCDNASEFDVWSTHPYTSGGPTHHAAQPDDVSLGDLPEMRATLQAAIRSGHVRSRKQVRFWVTEFSWDSNPPDHCGVPMSLLKRWVPESLYRMWASGVDLVGWFTLADLPIDESYFQSGLYFHGSTFAAAKPKGFLEGFRFPFVALRRGTSMYVWAHTPLGKPAQVVVEQTFKGGWKRVATIRTRAGIAAAVLKVKPIGRFRAVLPSGEKSLPFSVRVPPDRYFNTFGARTLGPNGSCS